MSNLFLIGFIEAVFLSLLIITKKRIKLSDVFLAIFLLLMGTRLLFIHLNEIGYSHLHPKIILMEFVYWPLFGPILFLYISSITSENEEFRWEYLLHFIPALLVFIAFFGYITDRGQTPLADYTNDGFFFRLGKFIWFYTTHVYFIICIIKLHRYRRKIKHFFSYRKNVDLKWLMILTYGFGIFLFFLLFYLLAKDHINWKLPEFTNHIIWLIMVVYVFGIGFWGYKQKGIFSEMGPIPKNPDHTDDANDNQDQLKNLLPRYSKSRLDESESRSILENLMGFVKENKPYLDSELNLRILAEELDTSPHKLSQVINAKLNKNFFEFINEYRINEAKTLLLSPEMSNLKIMAIAYDCGFNSKSSFFSIFKKMTGQTPSDFKKKNLRSS